jgi:catechol 2,3-dioxygenase-like lactoylglutathione lyase family enzyme
MESDRHAFSRATYAAANTNRPTEVTMSSTDSSTEMPEVGTIAMKLEVVTLPVSDVDRAKRFYQSLGWRLDADFAFSDDVRGVQLTPPHSGCSIHFGTGITTAEPGSVQRVVLAVDDIDRPVRISSAAASRSASSSTGRAGSFLRARIRSVART